MMRSPPRETSVQVYREIRDEGLLKKAQLRAYGALYENGPCTSRELDGFLGVLSNGLKRAQQPVVKMMVEMGVAQEIGYTKCSVTQRRVLYYDVTAKHPKKPRYIPDVEDVKVFLNTLIKYECLFQPKDMAAMEPVVGELFWKIIESNRKRALRDVYNRRQDHGA